MAVRDRIIALLGSADGADDDAIAVALGLKVRQHANQECRKLERAGLIERRKVNGKIGNFLLVRGRQRDQGAKFQEAARISSECGAKPWFWEGNVQMAAIAFLGEIDFKIQSQADTRARERGPDIIAVSDAGEMLLVSVKGKPEGSLKTAPYNQARHYFAGAVFDVVSWRSGDKNVRLALALPDFVTYRNLAKRIRPQLDELRASILWVCDGNRVEIAPDFLTEKSR